MAFIRLHMGPRRPRSESSHGVGPGHLLQDGDEEADLHLGNMS